MCVHRTDEGICKKFSVDGVTSYCVDGPCKDEVLTNADRIRSMSDEELLDFMVKIIGNAYMCKILRTEPMFCTLDWLRQPAEEDA